MGIVLGLLIAAQFAFKETGAFGNKKNNDPVIKYSSPDHPTKLSFAGEAVPLDRWDVEERLDRKVSAHYNPQLISSIRLPRCDRNRLWQPRCGGDVAPAALALPAPTVFLSPSLSPHLGHEALYNEASNGADQ